jgi:PqqD family protein of HPr-rel-A system
MTLKLRDGVSTADTEYGVVLLDENSGEYWTLNPTGVLVLRTLLDGGSTDEAVRHLTEQYAVDAEAARQDVDDLLGGLRSAGLVRE